MTFSRKVVLADELSQSETLKYLYLLFDDADVLPLDSAYSMLLLEPIFLKAAYRVCVQYRGASTAHI